MNNNQRLFCNVCSNNIEIFNKDLSFSWDMHNQDGAHQRALHIRKQDHKQRSQLIDELSAGDKFGSTQAILQLADELEIQACIEMTRTDVQEQVKCDLSNELEHVLEPGFEVVLFGSRATGLAAQSDTDLDFYVDMAGAIIGEEMENHVLRKVGVRMKQQYDMWGNVRPVLSARTPVLRALHRPSGLSCDITVRNAYGVYNTRLLQLYLRNVPALRPLVLLLRYWAARYDLDQLINNYGLSLLALFYLQQQGYVPSVDALSYECAGEPRLIGSYWCVPYERVRYDAFREQVPPDLNVKHLLHGLFGYYGQFNFEKLVVCPLLGQPLPKRLFGDRGRRLPAPMDAYRKMLATDVTAREFDLARDGIKLQDPIDLAHNLTRETTRHQAQDFARSCASMHEHLGRMH